MKILFLCGSLEPGRDGVGDYTRLLAGACTARGHRCSVVALHDPHVTEDIDRTEGGVRLIRLPAAKAWSTRLARAAGLVTRHAPDWVSWQFVAYSFQPRGFLPGALLQWAGKMRGTRCHVMMHELWLGLEADAGWRPRLIGWRQRQGIRRLLRQLQPECVQTTNASYRSALERLGIEAGVLALFGNVPVAEDFPRDTPPFAPWLPGVGDRAPFLAVTFGLLHPQWKPAATIQWLVTTARRLGRPPALLALGRTGAGVARVLDEFQRQGVAVGATGELDPAVLSALLSAADAGLALHPWALIGKSGAAAAMLDHGLPVLVPRDDWHLRKSIPATANTADPLLQQLAGLDAAGTDRWLACRRVPVPALPLVADTFLQALQLRPGPRDPECP